LSNRFLLPKLVKENASMLASKGTLLHQPHLTHESSLKTLVENRTIFNLNDCELNLFETYESSEKVALKFNDVVLTSMLRGKKVMHLYEDPEFEYLPGETVILPSNVEMKIDFPEARTDNPTQCLALEIDRAKIQGIIDLLNERYPKENKEEWHLNFDHYLLSNNDEIAGTLNKLMTICTSSQVTKDVLADLTLQELMIHLIQLQTRDSISSVRYLDSPIGQLIDFIRGNLTQKISMKELTNKACMSNATLYRYIKRETGMSPVELLLRERIRHAKHLLKNQSLLITEIAFASGFDDANYFTRVFKKMEGLSPRQYQKMASH
jgi:AraC-like DNA-binding protein